MASPAPSPPDDDPGAAPERSSAVSTAGSAASQVPPDAGIERKTGVTVVAETGQAKPVADRVAARDRATAATSVAAVTDSSRPPVSAPERDAMTAEASPQPGPVSATAPSPRSTDPFPTPSALGIRRQDVDRLMARFIQAYELGDLGRFTALFSNNAVSNDGIGRDVIRSSYRRFFTDTERRSLQVFNLAWSGDQGGRASLVFTVDIAVDRGLFSPTSHFSGEVNMRLVQQGNQLLISEFRHQVD